jgi:competence protein ComEC
MVRVFRRFEVLVPACGLWLAVSCSDQDAPGTDPGESGASGMAGAAGTGGADGGANGGRAGSNSRPSGGAAGAGTSGGNGNGGSSDGGTGSIVGDAGSGGEATTLDIYWVDVEGGAATIIKTPEGKVLLTDAGNPGGRDSARILSLLERELGAEKIDHLIITHYHSDHTGGVAAVAAGIDVLEFIDHGESVEEGADQDYVELAAGRRRTVAPGDSVQLGSVTLTIVQAHGQGISDPLGPDMENPFCEGAEPGNKDTGDENGMSVGYLLEFGTFQFLNLGDLTWGFEHELACPINKLGEVDLFQVPRHGFEGSSPPQLIHALNPLAAVVSNGANKGNDPSTYERLLDAPDLEAVWLLHRSQANDAEHNPPESRIANLSSGASDEAHFLHATVQPDGEFTIVNSRDGYSETYRAR